MVYNVLIIGDDVAAHVLLDEALRSPGFQVSMMPDGQCAGFPGGDIRSDLIIFDSLEPGTQGWGALRRIRRQSSVPIIALTDASRGEVKITSLDCGADYCLLKPFDVAEFQARVRALLRRRAICLLDC